MSERIRSKIGEDLYNKVVAAGLKPEEFDLLDGFVPRARLNEQTGKVTALQGKIESYEKQIGETQTLLKGSEELKGQYSQLQEKYQADLALKDKEITNVLKKSLFKEHLVKEGAKHIDLLMNQVNFETISVDNNNLIGGADVITKLKTDYSDLFIKTEVKGTPSGTGSSTTPPAGTDSDNPFAKYQSKQ